MTRVGEAESTCRTVIDLTCAKPLLEMETDIDLIVRDLTDLPTRGAPNQRDRLLRQLSDLRTTADRAVDGVLDQSIVDVQASLAPLQEDMVAVKTEVADLGS